MPDDIYLCGSFESYMKKDEIKMINLNDFPSLIEKDLETKRKAVE